MNEKRSPGHENAQMDLLGMACQQGVGARQESVAHHPEGGGYPDVCMVLDFEKKPPRAEKIAARDPRLDDLQRMGIPRVWMQVAEAIGADAFLETWRIIDADPASWQNDTFLRVRLRPYRSYLRYQRNRFIESLAAQGLRPDEIKRRLRAQLGEEVSDRHILRLAKADRLAQA